MTTAVEPADVPETIDLDLVLHDLVEEPTIDLVLALYRLGHEYHNDQGRRLVGEDPLTHFLAFAPLTAPESDCWLEPGPTCLYRFIHVAAPMVAETKALRLHWRVELKVTPVVETHDTGFGGADCEHLLVEVTRKREKFTLAFSDEAAVYDLLEVVEEAAREASTVEAVEEILSAGAYAAAALLFATGANLAAASPALR